MYCLSSVSSLPPLDPPPRCCILRCSVRAGETPMLSAARLKASSCTAGKAGMWACGYSQVCGGCICSLVVALFGSTAADNSHGGSPHHGV